MIGMWSSLTVRVVTVLLGYDLAGGKVIENPKVLVLLVLMA